MGDHKKTNGAEKPKTSEIPSDKNKEAPRAPQTPAELTAIKAKEQQAKVETKEKTSGISREILGEQVIGIDKDTAEKIISLDEKKETKEQSDAFERLKLVSYTFLGKIFKDGIKKEAVEDFEKLKTIPPEIVNKFNATEKVTLKKLQEIASKPGSKLCNELKILWKNITSYAHETFEKTQDKSWIDKMYREHKYLLITGAALGAIGIGYYVFFRNTQPGTEGQNQNTFLDKIGLGSTKRKITAGVIGTLVLGGIIGHKQIGEWMEKLTGAPAGTVGKLVDLVKAGKFKEAWFLLSHWNETTQEIIEGVEKGMEWLEEKVHFGAMKEAIKKFCTDHNMTLPDWMKDLSLGQIAKDLGITKENSGETLKDFAVAGGAGYLIYKYLGKKGLAMNAGIYMFVVRNGHESIVGKMMGGLAGEVDKAKDKILGGLKNVPGLDTIIEDSWIDFKSEEATKHMFDWIGKHPAEAMLAMNGLWICRSLIYKALKKLLQSGEKFAKFVYNNPGKSALAAGGLATLYFGRREFIKDFIGIAYDNPNSKEAQEMLADLDKLAGVDRKEQEKMYERQIPAFAKSMVEDPFEALKKLTNIEEYKKGGWAIFVNELGVVSLLVKGASVPIQLAKLTWSTMSTTYQHIFSPEGNKDGLLVPMMVAGVEGYVFGASAWEGFKSYKTVFESGGIERGEKIWRGIKSLIPGTKEWRFVMKSCLAGPILPILKTFESMKLGVVERQLDKIIELAKQKNFPKDEIRKLVSDIQESSIMKDFTAMQNDLSKANWGKYSFDLAQRMKLIKNNLGQIDLGAAGNSAEEVMKWTKLTKNELRGTQKTGASLYQRVKSIFSGDTKSVLATAEAAEEMAKIEKEMPKTTFEAEAPKVGEEPKATEKPKATTAVSLAPIKSEVFKKPDGTYKTINEAQAEMARLRNEVNGLGDTVERAAKEKQIMALEAYANPEKAHGFKIDAHELENLHGAEKAKRLTEVAREFEARERGLQSKLNAEIKKIGDEAKLRNVPLSDPSVMEKLEKLDQELTIPFAKNKQEVIGILNTEFKKLPAEFRKNPAISSQIARAIEGTEGSLMTRIVKGGKGRAKMMVLMASLIFCTDQIVHRNGPERELKKIITDLGPELGQLLLDVSPVAGTFSNYYSAISGKEIVTKRDVSSTWDRTTNAIWGTVGLAGDAITVVEALPTGGESVFANMELRLAKIVASEGRMSKAAEKLILYLPRLERICDKMGGITKFFEKTKEFMKAENSLGKGIRAIEKVGMVAGTAMLVGGLAYHMRYAFVDNKTEIDLAPELANASTMPTPEVQPGEVPAAA